MDILKEKTTAENSCLRTKQLKIQANNSHIGQNLWKNQE